MNDLKTLALRNTDQLRSWQDALQMNNHEFSLLQFIDRCTNVSINMFIIDLISVLSSTEIQNMYDHVRSDKETSENIWPGEQFSTDEMNKARFKSFYKKRVAFDSMFNNGENFKYTALNVTGLGLLKYGNYCINFNRHNLEIIFLANESLKYFNEKGNFDSHLFEKELCLNEILSALVLKKHQNQVSIGKFDLRNVCKESDYIEGIVLDTLTTSEIENICITNDLYEAYFEIYTRSYTDGLDEHDKNHLKLFIMMNQMLQNKKINLTHVDPLASL